MKMAFGVVAMMSAAVAYGIGMPDASKPGYKQVGGVVVPSGVAVTAESDVVLGEGAEFRKAGAGEFVLPLSKVNRQREWGAVVSEGTLKITPGDDATYPVGNVPAVFNKAALWLAADSGGVVVTGGTFVAKWVDVRDAATPDAPTYPYATPAWGSNVPAANKGVPPEKVVKDGRTSLYFGGKGSGKHMNLSSGVTDIYHQFVVHGVYSCFGAVVGYSTSRVGMTPSYTSACPSYPCAAHFVSRGELSPEYYSARHFLDGKQFSPFSQGPNGGFQLLGSEFLHKRTSVNKVFRFCFESLASNDTDKGSYVQGGDYVAEIVLFTTRLSSAEVLDVERYLMRKWALGPTAATETVARLPDMGKFGVGSSAVLEVATATDETTPLLSVTGDGTVEKTGAGTLDLGPTYGLNGSATLDLKAGTVLVRGGRPLPVALKAGDRFESVVYNAQNGGARSKDTDIASGAKLTRTTAASSDGLVEKTGNDWLRVNEIGSDVTCVNVKEGVLQLEGKSFAGAFASGAITAVVKNATFEAPVAKFEYANGRHLIGTSDDNGWRAVSGNNQPAYIAYTNADARVWFGGSSSLPTSGNQVLMFSGGAAAETTVSLPKSGDYELEFYANNRYNGSTKYENLLNVYFGADAASLASVGTVIFPSNSNFQRYRFRLNGLSAGSAVLRFKVPRNQLDGGSLQIDDVRLVLVGKKAGMTAFDVPNGDFENVETQPSGARLCPYYSTVNTATGWTFFNENATLAGVTTNSTVGLVAPGTLFYGSSDSMLQNITTDPMGSWSLLFTKNGGVAESAPFAAPKGRFRLKARLARRSFNYTPYGKGEVSAEDSGVVKATVRLADGTTSTVLGTITVSSFQPAEYVFATAVEIPSAQNIVLRLEQAHPSGIGAALVDDLAFIPASEDLDGNYLADGNMENATSGWTAYVSPSIYKNSYAQKQAYSDTSSAYGYAAFEGSKALAFEGHGGARQTVNFHTPGLYRFVCHARSRADHKNYSDNDMKFWFAKSGSSVTNVIDTMPVPYACNFLERAYLFRIAEAGDYVFGMEGAYSGDNANADVRTFVDGVSIRRVDDGDAGATASIAAPEALTLKIAAGARLVLDYPGTNEVAHLRLGGRSVKAGTVVTAVSRPDFVGGVGALKVIGPDPGLALIVR